MTCCEGGLFYTQLAQGEKNLDLPRQALSRVSEGPK